MHRTVCKIYIAPFLQNYYSEALSVGQVWGNKTVWRQRDYTWN